MSDTIGLIALLILLAGITRMIFVLESTYEMVKELRARPAAAEKPLDTRDEQAETP